MNNLANRVVPINYATATEEELRKAPEPKPQSIEELSEFMRVLVSREHDYGTCVYAMSLCAVAAFNLVAHELGVTGFQASCADMDVLRYTRNFKWGRIVNYDDLLYPQYLNIEHFPSHDYLLDKEREELARRAKMLLTEHNSGPISIGVEAHWHWLANRGHAK